jgi:TonB family protein
MPVDELHFLLSDATGGKHALERRATSVLLSLLFHFVLIVLLSFGPAFLMSDEDREKMIQPTLTQLLTNPPPGPPPAEEARPKLNAPWIAPPPPVQKAIPPESEPIQAPPSLRSPIAQLKPDSSAPSDSAAAGPPPQPADHAKDAATSASPPAQPPENGSRNATTNLRDLMARLQLPRSVLEDSQENLIHKGGTGGGLGSLDEKKYDRRLKDFSIDEPTILSNTQGMDFSTWLRIVSYRVRDNWYAVIPEIIRSGTQGKTILILDVDALGHVTNLEVAKPSGLPSYDRAAMSSIRMSEPFPAFPNGFTGQRLTLRVSYLYNLTR